MDMTEENQDRGFKVKDRRRFSPENAEVRKHQDASSLNERRTASRESTAQQSSSALPEVTFPSFILGLSTQALIYLGEVPDPQDGQSRRDLSAARHLIDVLGMLQNKTAGNLEKDEEQFLDRILFDLRTRYVELGKQE